MEIKVVLHFADHTTATTVYPVAKLADALAHFAQYVAEGKRATIQHTNE